MPGGEGIGIPWCRHNPGPVGGWEAGILEGGGLGDCPGGVTGSWGRIAKISDA